jgi:hypothetical protein
MGHCGQRGLCLGNWRAGEKRFKGPRTRKRTRARSGRVEAGFKTDGDREDAIFNRSVSAAQSNREDATLNRSVSAAESECCRRGAGACAGAQAPGRVEAAAGFKTNQDRNQQRGKGTTGGTGMTGAKSKCMKCILQVQRIKKPEPLGKTLP